jgi:hypothetical protein
MEGDRLRHLPAERAAILAEISRQVALVPTGQHYRCACPRHEDRTLPLYIHPERGIFTCFGCGWTGKLAELSTALLHGPGAFEEAPHGAVAGIAAEEQSGDVSEPSTPVSQREAPSEMGNVDIELMARELGVTPEKLLAIWAAARTGTTAESAPPSRKKEPTARPQRTADDRRRELAAILAPENLRLAWRKVKKFAEEHDVYFDAQMFGLWEQHLDANLYLLGERLRKLTSRGEAYAPGPLRHLRLTKPSGGTRDIAIMSRVEDRVVIQAVMNVLTPRMEKEFSPNSFGHRRADNFEQSDLVFQRWPELWSRYQGKLRKFLWLPETCAYVKGDLSAFYDQVDRERLHSLLVDYAHDDWTLRTLDRFLHYDLLLDDGKPRSSSLRGLPQGPAYGHVLANLYLDAFDRFVEGELAADQDALLQEEIRRLTEWLEHPFADPPAVQPRRAASRRDALGYCRYVDDFMIVFESREAAEEGLGRLRGALAEWGLALSEEKTGVHDATDLDPVVDEMKSRKYTLGKLLDNDASLSTDQREALYQVVENDLMGIAMDEDAGRAAQSIGFVAHKLSQADYFDRNEEALVHLVIELLFSESFKHSAMAGVLQKMLPRIISAHFATEFARHLLDEATPAFKRVLFLQAVQDNGFYADLGPGLQECVRGFLRDPCFFVRVTVHPGQAARARRQQFCSGRSDGAGARSKPAATACVT